MLHQQKNATSTTTKTKVAWVSHMLHQHQNKDQSSMGFPDATPTTVTQNETRWMKDEE